MNKVAKAVCHGALEGGSSIFEAKGHDPVCKCAPWGCEFHLVVVFFPDLELVRSGKIVHEGKGFMTGTCINDLIDERCGEVVFGTCPIEVTKVCANANGTLFFIHENRIRNPSCLCNGINEADSAQLLYLGFHRSHFGWMDGPLLLVDGCHIRPCVDVLFHDGWI